MPRQARKISHSGIYHIIFRGIDKQDIFLDKYDKMKMLKEIRRTKEKYEYKLYCYCLMNNHIHLIIKDEKENLFTSMQSLAISYSSYFNLKYERVGHLFQNRYTSKEVDTDEYLLTLQRYIHQNPEKAGIDKTERYQWSSYKEYAVKSFLIDEDFLLNMLDSNKEKAIRKFKQFNEQFPLDINILDYEMKNRLTDEEAKEWIENLLVEYKISDIKKYNLSIRNELIRKIKEKHIISNNQLSRITGLNRKIIDRV